MYQRMYQTVILASILMGLVSSVRADLILEHFGSTDPLTEGFTTTQFGGPSSTAALANDLGVPAWSITGTSQISQLGYESSPLTLGQKADIAAAGFTLTLDARILQNIAPVYDSTNHVVIGGTSVSYMGARYGIELGLNSNGDTVAVLPTFLDINGPGASVRAPGANFITSGNDYHIYQLLYDPVSNTADFFIDGIKKFEDYAGHTSFVGDGLIMGVSSGGQGNFHHVQLVSGNATVPEPSSFVLFLAVMGGIVRQRRRKGRING